MGALKGPIAVRRYAVLDPLPAADVRKKLVRGLRAHAFLPIDPDAPGGGDTDRSVGWVAIHDPDDADLQPEKVFFPATGGEQLRAALRVDVLKPPASEVRRQVASRAAGEEAARGRPLVRSERRLLKEEVTRVLRRRAFPRVKVADLVWNLDTGRLWLWSQTKAMNEAFVDLFGKSFALRVGVDGPGRWARASVDERLLARLEPTRELWAGFDGVRPLGGAVNGAVDADGEAV